MCGNGKSCEECGRGPCGPTYTAPTREEYTKAGKCWQCGGNGKITKRNIYGDIRRGVTCDVCYGTGKPKRFIGKFTATVEYKLWDVVEVKAKTKTEAVVEIRKMLEERFKEMYRSIDINNIEEIWSAK